MSSSVGDPDGSKLWRLVVGRPGGRLLLAGGSRKLTRSVQGSGRARSGGLGASAR